MSGGLDFPWCPSVRPLLGRTDGFVRTVHSTAVSTAVVQIVIICGLCWSVKIQKSSYYMCVIVPLKYWYLDSLILLFFDRFALSTVASMLIDSIFTSIIHTELSIIFLFIFIFLNLLLSVSFILIDEFDDLLMKYRDLSPLCFFSCCMWIWLHVSVCEWSVCYVCINVFWLILLLLLLFECYFFCYFTLKVYLILAGTFLFILFWILNTNISW